MKSQLEPTTVRERNKLRTRRDILTAVLEVFDEAGFSACSVERVAKRVGCSKATIYVYFPGGLEEMFREIYSELSDELIGAAQAKRDAHSDPVDRIIGLGEALLDLSTRPLEGRFFALSNPSLSPVLHPVLGKGSKLFGDLIARDLATFRIAASDEKRATVAILIVGAMREASIKVAEDPSQRQTLLSGLRTLVSSLRN